jgi:hypothetical protein
MNLVCFCRHNSRAVASGLIESSGHKKAKGGHSTGGSRLLRNKPLYLLPYEGASFSAYAARNRESLCCLFSKHGWVVAIMAPCLSHK